MDHQTSFSTAIPSSSGRVSPPRLERDGSGGRREAVLLLRLPQQLHERRVAEVGHPHHEPPALHAHRHVPRRHRRVTSSSLAGGARRGDGGSAGPPPPQGAAQAHQRRDGDRDLAHVCLLRLRLLGGRSNWTEEAGMAGDRSASGLLLCSGLFALGVMNRGCGCEAGREGMGWSFIGVALGIGHWSWRKLRGWHGITRCVTLFWSCAVVCRACRGTGVQDAADAVLRLQ
ncbi:hypothetical protein HU200_006659 [Digitaria exilis]|uniref:Uncharacterized protein n=1 Tax=Digitaria exilis TaxID=1010633 RepID=A0A835KQ99_9POAL|nr:hypothetical protein HU200_006659 [Digitaria exilis]